ncbi:hypothetical protein [Nostoc sp. UHCC 0251]|uniref:hypothetical protein n=1 Tax=Nostoc sp. UHCC 0251 TaxID=3110240 RepID=UPI002B1F4312|nr:hypothetical protein [Nostoc sp. UHCC 0251]MEA5625273.1 hypothetical protein [Nostoc sp. UHCC 0251]
MQAIIRYLNATLPDLLTDSQVKIMDSNAIASKSFATDELTIGAYKSTLLQRYLYQEYREIG